MVTLITDKLKHQTLNEIPSTETTINEHLKTRNEDTTRIFSTQRNKGFVNGENTFVTTGRCQSYPPAKKRLCRTKSDPFHEIKDSISSWIPEPSTIWTPVKKPREGCKTTCRSLEFKKDVTWSTPPESPIQRPVSANAVLENLVFTPLRFISEETSNVKTESVVLPRSHSHPCFSNIANSGLKRRLSEIDLPRPALDFDKMKATCLGHTSLHKRAVKSPKYAHKRHQSTSPKHCNPCRRDTTNVNVVVDLTSSLLITPSSSPTQTQESGACFISDENSNNSYTDDKHSSPIDSDLDIKLIEEDDTIHNAYIL